MKLFFGLLSSLFVLLAFGAAHYIQKPARADELPSQPPAPMKFRIDADHSKFMVHAHRGGILWFKGNDHFVKVGRFSGEVTVDPADANGANLVMTIESDSLEETGAVFTAPQKATIKKELNDIVLEKDKFPQITFRSTGVTARLENQQFNVRIKGDISLHGVTRQIEIPATVSIEGNNLRAKGHFTLDRKKFNVKATTAGHGTVRVKHKLDFDFDILATSV
jgi:polyisoprenoid-binding protein YceI